MICSYPFHRSDSGDVKQGRQVCRGPPGLPNARTGRRQVGIKGDVAPHPCPAAATKCWKPRRGDILGGRVVRGTASAFEEKRRQASG